MKSSAISFAVVACFASTLLAGTNDVLFVGNSFTHGHADPALSFNKANVTDENGSGYGGVPGIFKAMTSQAGLSYNVSIEAVSSSTLAYHYTNKASIIGQAKWGTVVLQENSTEPLPNDNPSGFLTAASNLKNLIAASNPATKTILYETWASPTTVTAENYSPGVTGLHQMTQDLQNAYFKAYYNYGFTDVARVGDAFMKAVDDGYAPANPSAGVPAGQFSLWGSDDWRHASKYGSYLSAAVMYGKITHNDPRQLLTSGTTSTATQLGISSTDATTLDTIAYQINALANPAAILTTRLAVSKATFTGSVTAGATPNITGNAMLASITTSEGTFSNLIGATAGGVASTNANSSIGTAPASKNAAVSGLSANDGANNLSTGNFQFSGQTFDANTRFVIVDSTTTASTAGDAATVTLIDSAGNAVGSFTLSLAASDFTNTPAGDTASALATLSYNSGVTSVTGGVQSKLGAVSFALSDLGVTDYAAIANATGIRIASSSLDPNVVATYSVPEPAACSLFAVASGVIMLKRRRGR